MVRWDERLERRAEGRDVDINCGICRFVNEHCYLSLVNLAFTSGGLDGLIPPYEEIKSSNNVDQISELAEMFGMGCMHERWVFTH
jgi:hypothetical protein